MKRLSLDFQTVMSAIAVLGMMLAVAGTWPDAAAVPHAATAALRAAAA